MIMGALKGFGDPIEKFLRFIGNAGHGGHTVQHLGNVIKFRTIYFQQYPDAPDRFPKYFFDGPYLAITSFIIPASSGIPGLAKARSYRKRPPASTEILSFLKISG